MTTYHCAKCGQEWESMEAFGLHIRTCTLNPSDIARLQAMQPHFEERTTEAMLATCRIERDQQYKRAEEYGRQLDIVWACLVLSALVNIGLIFKIWG